MPFMINPPIFGAGTPAYPSYRYYRITFIGTLGDLTAIAEVELASTPGGANIATGQSYTGSSGILGSVGGSAPSIAFDGNANTFSYDGTPLAVDPYLQVDFTTATTVAEVRLKVRNDAFYYQGPSAFSLAGSPDGSTWTGLGVFSGYTAWASAGESKTFAVPTTALTNSRTDAFMWRLRSTASQGGGGPGIAELIMATSGGGATICSGGDPIFSTVFSTATTYRPDKMFDGNASTFYIAYNNTGGARCQFGYIFPTAVAPTEFRISARNDGFHADSPTAGTIQWSSDGINWTTTDTISGLSWTSGETKTFSITP